MQRQEQLDQVTDALLSQHKAWMAYPGDDPPGPDYWAAVDQAIKAFSKGAIPRGYRRLTIAVDKLRQEVDKYNERDDMESQNPQPGFFYAIDKIADLRRLPTKADLPPLEPVAELMRLPNMSLRQVATMYRAFLPNGEPDQSRIKRELEKPGSEFPAGYDPRIAELEAADEDAGELPVFNDTGSAPEDKPCPETPLDLWEQDVSPEQAARMLRQPINDVVAMFRKFDKDHKRKKQAASS